MEQEFVYEVFNQLHKIPETSNNEFKTSDLIESKLREIGFSSIERVSETGLVISLDSGNPGPIIALRADTDALPYTLNGVHCAMHTCAHDAHASILLSAAKLIFEHGISKGKLILVFQHAEEAGTGAIDIANSGNLKDVGELYGLHLRPIEELKLGEATPALCHGSGYTLKAIIKGLASHAARPHQGINTIDAAALAINSVNSIHLKHTIPYSVKATKIKSVEGSTNTIPEETEIFFDLRAQTNTAMDDLIKKTKLAVISSSSSIGADSKIEITDGSPAAEYDIDAIKYSEKAIIEVLGKSSPPLTTTGCDDFHFYTKILNLKASFIGLGANLSPGLHSPEMIFDKKALEYGRDILTALAISRLN